MSSSEGANSTNIPLAYEYDADAIRDSSDYTVQLKERILYTSYTDNNYEDKKPSNPWMKYSNQFRYSYLFGRLKCDSCSGNAFTGSVPLFKLGAGWVFNVSETNRAWTSITSSDDATKLAATVGGPDYIYTSTDSGASWTQTSAPLLNWFAVASSSFGTNLVAVILGGQIYTSTDSGATWIARESTRNWVSVASSADGTKLVAGVSGSATVFTSTNSGVTWTSTNVGVGNRNWRGVASSDDGTNLVFVTFGGFIYTSTNSGANWNARMTDIGRNWFSVTSSTDGTKLAAVVFGGQIYTSTNSGVTWTARDTNRNWYSISSSTDGTKLAAVVNGGYLYISTNSGVTWVEQTTLGTKNWYSVTLSSDGTKLAAVVNGGQIYTGIFLPDITY